MLELNKKNHSVEAPFWAAPLSSRLKPTATSELDRLEREIVSTDAEIDEIAYQLYAITDEAKKIIEGDA